MKPLPIKTVELRAHSDGVLELREGDRRISYRLQTEDQLVLAAWLFDMLYESDPKLVVTAIHSGLAGTYHRDDRIETKAH